MNKYKPDICTQTDKVICDWSDKRNSLIHYWMSKFNVRHGMIVEKNHEIVSFKQSEWREKYKNYSTQKRKQVEKIWKRISITYTITHSMVKQWKVYEVV